MSLYNFSDYDHPPVLVEIEDSRLEEVKEVLDRTRTPAGWHLQKVSEGGAADAMSADELIEWSRDFAGEI